MKKQNTIIKQEKKPDVKEKGKSVRKPSKVPSKEVVVETEPKEPVTDVLKIDNFWFYHHT